MPEPGSHAHDVHRTRLRAEIDDDRSPEFHRTPEGEVDEKADQLLGGDTPRPTPSAHGPRSGGPAGQKAERGDPGPVLGVRSVAVTDGAMVAVDHSEEGGSAPVGVFRAVTADVAGRAQPGVVARRCASTTGSTRPSCQRSSKFSRPIHP